MSRAARVRATRGYDHAATQSNLPAIFFVLFNRRGGFLPFAEAAALVRAVYPSAPFVQWGKHRLCVLDRHYAGTA